MSNEKGVLPSPKVHGFESVSKFCLKKLNDELTLCARKIK